MNIRSAAEKVVCNIYAAPDRVVMIKNLPRDDLRNDVVVDVVAAAVAVWPMIIDSPA